MNRPPLKGALVGCGQVSRHHLAGWARIPEVELVALCDRDPARLDAAVAPGARRYHDFAALLKTETKLDFVEICTQVDAHRALVEQAAARGSHVLCQKPAAATRGDLIAMIGACDRAGVRLMIHENWRFRPWYRAIRQVVAIGRVGRPIRLRLAHRDFRALRPGGFDEQPYLATAPRLMLMDMGCHLVDCARFLLGEVATVSATLRRFGVSNLGEDVATLVLEFESGSLGLLDFSWCAAPLGARLEWALNETVVEGDSGTIHLLKDGSLEFVGLDGATERIPVDLPPPAEVYLAGYLATQRHFIQGLLTGIAHETSGQDALETMSVVWAAYQSADEGRTISIERTLAEDDMSG